VDQPSGQMARPRSWPAHGFLVVGPYCCSPIAAALLLQALLLQALLLQTLCCRPIAAALLLQVGEEHHLGGVATGAPCSSTGSSRGGPAVVGPAGPVVGQYPLGPERFEQMDGQVGARSEPPGAAMSEPFPMQPACGRPASPSPSGSSEPSPSRGGSSNRSQVPRPTRPVRTPPREDGRGGPPSTATRRASGERVHTGRWGSRYEGHARGWDLRWGHVDEGGPGPWPAVHGDDGGPGLGSVVVTLAVTGWRTVPVAAP